MKPNLRELATALCLVGDILGTERADYCFEGRFRFELGGDWSLVISAEDAGRLRLDACLRSRVRATLWTPATDRARLERLVMAARDEAAVLAA